jgi:hypothetical protein
LLGQAGQEALAYPASLLGLLGLLVLASAFHPSS